MIITNHAEVDYDRVVLHGRPHLRHAECVRAGEGRALREDPEAGGAHRAGASLAGALLVASAALGAPARPASRSGRPWSRASAAASLVGSERRDVGPRDRPRGLEPVLPPPRPGDPAPGPAPPTSRSRIRRGPRPSPHDE
ncbi:MAG: hypothetical protein MZV70_45480 [Desulfobacterales bacterium]|nr:hypothetical protein [Desulfobacterales bacterium]